MFGGRQNEGTMAEAVLNFLNIMPATRAWRMETTGMPRRNADGSFRLVRNRERRGKPDIAGFKGLTGFLIELKMPGEKLKPEQELWHQDFRERTGATERIAVWEGVDEVEAFWKGLP